MFNKKKHPARRARWVAGALGTSTFVVATGAIGVGQAYADAANLVETDDVLGESEVDPQEATSEFASRSGNHTTSALRLAGAATPSEGGESGGADQPPSEVQSATAPDVDPSSPEPTASEPEPTAPEPEPAEPEPEPEPEPAEPEPEPEPAEPEPEPEPAEPEPEPKPPPQPDPPVSGAS